MSIEQQVFGLQVAVDDVLLVKVVERQGDLGSIELCDRIGKSLRA